MCVFTFLYLFRVFTFGIGSGASTALVKGLAKAGNGTAEFIQEGERLQPKVGEWRVMYMHVPFRRAMPSEFSCST